MRLPRDPPLSESSLLMRIPDCYRAAVHFLAKIGKTWQLDILVVERADHPF